MGKVLRYVLVTSLSRKRFGLVTYTYRGTRDRSPHGRRLTLCKQYYFDTRNQQNEYLLRISDTIHKTH